jgi:large subunit ribosomal protein L24
MKIKTGDRVVVIAGASKGMVGIVQEVFKDKNRVVIDGVNMLTYNIKPSNDNPEGGQEKSPGPIDVSNVMIIEDQKSKDNNTDNIKVSKIKIEIIKDKNGRTSKKRILKSNGMEV